MSDRRQKVLLATLGLLIVYVGWRAVVPTLFGRTGGGLLGLPERGGIDAVELPAVVELELGELEAEAGAYSPGRDPFRFELPPPPPPPAPPPAPAPVVRPAPAPAPAAPARAQPPPVDVIYLGSFGPASQRIAVFTDGNDIYNARLGDVVKERFIVDNIGYESADLAFVGFPDAPAQRLAAGG